MARKMKQPGLMQGVTGQPGLYPPGGSEGGTGQGLKPGQGLPTRDYGKNLGKYLQKKKGNGK